MHKDLLDVVRGSHWTEIAEFLGQPVKRVQETFRLYLQLLDQLGYSLVRKGDAPPSAAPIPPTELAPAFDRRALFAAVEGAILATTERRLAGERISDQAEVRSIVQAVEDEISGARAGA